MHHHCDSDDELDELIYMHIPSALPPPVQCMTAKYQCDIANRSSADSTVASIGVTVTPNLDDSTVVLISLLSVPTLDDSSVASVGLLSLPISDDSYIAPITKTLVVSHAAIPSSNIDMMTSAEVLNSALT